MSTQHGGASSTSSSSTSSASSSAQAVAASAPSTQGPAANMPTPSSVGGPQMARSASAMSSKSAAAASSSKPELPWAFIDCPTEPLVTLIAHMLDLLCQHNDQVVLTPDALTRFHSRAPPGISVIEYLRRIVKYTNLEKIPLLSLLAYIDLTCQNLPSFTLSSLTVHRFLIAGVTAGSKAQCDVFCTNSHYAKVGGIKVPELNSLEREFLRVTGWALCCSPELLQRYYTSLIRSHGGYVQAPEPPVSPFLSLPLPPEPVSGAVTPSEGRTDNEEDLYPDDAPYHMQDEDSPRGSDTFDTAEDGGVTDAATKTDMAVDSPQVGPGTTRGVPTADAMEVDPSDGPAAPATATEPAPPVHDADRAHDSSLKSSAPHAHSQKNTLKSFVGGIFRRRDEGPHGAHLPAPEKKDEQRRSRPLTTTHAADMSTGTGAGTGGRNSPDHPKAVTPRIRTRDERSVDSLRTRVGGAPGAMPPAIPVEDAKRRARVE